MWHSRTGEAMQFSKKNDSIGNSNSNLNFTTASLTSFGPGMVDEVDEAFLKYEKGNLYVTPGFAIVITSRGNCRPRFTLSKL